MEDISLKYKTKQTFDVDFLKKLNSLLLVLHICFMIIFFLAKYTILGCVNILSVLYYLFYLKYSNNYRIYVYYTIVEVVLHASAVALLMGWDYGFQYYLFALVPIFFYVSHFGKESSAKRMNPMYQSLLLGIMGIVLKTLTHFIKPIYVTNSPWLVLIIVNFNIIVSVSFLIFFVREYRNVVKKHESIIRSIAQTDQLTQLNNRNKITEIIDEDLSDNGMAIGLAIIDIDDFKMVNDTYGHLVGDYVLVKLAKDLASISSDRIITSRWGGEEFLVFARKGIGYNEFKGILSDLVNRISINAIIYNEERIATSISVGLTKHNRNDDLDSMINRADQYLYKCKSNGKNQLLGD